MRKLICLFVVIFFLSSNLKTACIYAMTPLQKYLYQIAVVELDVDKTLLFLQQENLDLNIPIDVNGRMTTFLHELIRSAETNTLMAVQVNETSDYAYEHYIYEIGTETNPVYYSSRALQLMIRLFLSYGADVDISDFSGLSVREAVGNGFAELDNSFLSSFIVNFPLSNSHNYQRFKEQLKNSVLTEIKIIKCSYFILLIIASMLCIGLYRYS